MDEDSVLDYGALMWVVSRHTVESEVLSLNSLLEVGHLPPISLFEVRGLKLFILGEEGVLR